jgi:hypothetical protein
MLSRALDTVRQGGQVMKKLFALLVGGMSLLALAPPAQAQVEKVELDVAGYLCGL